MPIAHSPTMVFTLIRARRSEEMPEEPFFRSAPDLDKWRRDPREEPVGALLLDTFGKRVAAVREACGGLVSRIEIDWKLGEVSVHCIVPKHIDPSAMQDALAMRLRVIERRMGLQPADADLDDLAIKALSKLLPPPPATDS
jgi:hypothetical protein